VDLESGVWCACVGHANPAVTEAVAGQWARLGHAGYCYSSPVAEEAGQRVLALLGMEGGRCALLCSGSEAVEYCLRAARLAAPRPRFLTMADSYCGAYGTAHRKAAEEWLLFEWSQCAGCGRPDGDDACLDCPRLAAVPFAELGGFLLEPGSSSGLVRFPPARLVRALARGVRERGGLVVVNEVTTGMGRTGAWFGYEHYGLAPDAAALGKGLGNGYPVSAAALSPALAERLDGPVPYAQSHQNDPAGAAAALAVIRCIEEQNLLERCRELSAWLVAKLETLRGRFPAVREVRGRGLMLALEFHDRDPDLSRRLHRGLVERGYICTHRPGHNVLRLDPPLTVQREDLQGFLDALAALLPAA
jgi:acetylornithine aminotransferase